MTNKDELKLTSRAMLADLSIGDWNGSKIDRTTSDEVASDKHATADAGHYVKNMVGKEYLQPIKYISALARQRHYALTFPGFTQRGPRILASRGWEQHSQDMSAFKIEHEERVAHFLKQLPVIKRQRQVQLGDLWDDAEFPSEQDVAASFSFGIKYLPMPEASNWILDLDSASVDSLRADIEAETKAALSDAMATPFLRVSEAVANMADKLRGYGRDHKGKVVNRFHNSLIDNMRDLANTLPCLNINGDERLAALSQDMIDNLCSHNGESLRDNDVVRENVASEAERIAKEVAAWMA